MERGEFSGGSGAGNDDRSYTLPVHHASNKPNEEHSKNDAVSSSKIKKENVGKRKNSFCETTKTEEPKAKIPKMANFNSLPAEKNRRVAAEIACFISRLPTDLLTRIIELLPVKFWSNYELISRQFQAATFDAWRNLRAVNFKKMDEFRVAPGKIVAGQRKLQFLLQKLHQYSPFITSISGFENYVRHFQKWMIVSVANFHHLRSVEFGGAKLQITSQFLELFFTSLKNPNLLVDFTLQGCMRPMNTILTKIFRDMGLKLKKFCYKNSTRATGNFLQYVDCSVMEILNLSNTVFLRVDRNIITEFFSRFTELRKLNLNGFKMIGIRDQDIAYAVATNCPKLECLKMIDGDLFLRGRHSMIEVIPHLINLKRFEFTLSAPYPDEILRCIGTYLQNLTFLSLSLRSETNDIACCNLLCQLMNLRHLHLMGHIRRPVVEAISNNLHDLETLRLDRLVKKSAGALHTLCALTKLKRLSLCESVNHPALVDWARGGLLDRLEALKLNACQKVRDAGICFMATCGSENLQRLDLVKCDVSVDGIQAILKSFKNLRELRVRSCNRIPLGAMNKYRRQYGNVKILT